MMEAIAPPAVSIPMVRGMISSMHMSAGSPDPELENLCAYMAVPSATTSAGGIPCRGFFPK